MITLKEKKMLLKMKTAMGESTDELQAEIEAEENKLREQSESRKAAFSNIFTDLSKNLNELAVQDKQRSVEQQSLVEQLGALFNKMAIDPQVPKEIKEEFVKIDEAPVEDEAAPVIEAIDQPKSVEPPTTVDRVVSHVKETTAPSMFVQPNPPTVDKDIKAIQNKLKLLEGWVGKISMNGPGGGAVWLRDLDDIARASVKNATEGQALIFNGTTKKWEARTISVDGVVGTLDQVTTAGNTTLNPITVGHVHAEYFAVNTSATYSVSMGQIAWNPADLTFDMGMDNGVVLQVGQEQHMKVKAYEAVSDGQAVMFAGVDGDHILVRKYNPTITGFIPEWYVGVATQDLAHNGFGYVTTFGKVHGLNTLAWSAGDILYADNENPGALTNVAPTDPKAQIVVAAVTKRSGGDGHIFVRPSWRNSLNLATDVTLTSPSNGQVLTYVSSSNTWTNQTLNGFQTTAGLSANVATLTANNTLYLGGIAANQYAYANLTVSQLTGASGNVALYANGSMSFPLNRIETGTESVALWSSNQATVVWRGTGGAGLPLQSVMQSMPGYVNLGTATGILGGATTTYNWKFDDTGVMTFPDDTTQNTAWTGSVSEINNGIAQLVADEDTPPTILFNDVTDGTALIGALESDNDGGLNIRSNGSIGLDAGSTRATMSAYPGSAQVGTTFTFVSENGYDPGSVTSLTDATYITCPDSAPFNWFITTGWIITFPDTTTRTISSVTSVGGMLRMNFDAPVTIDPAYPVTVRSADYADEVDPSFFFNMNAVGYELAPSYIKFPSYSGSPAKILVDNSNNDITIQADGTHSWKFNANGALSFPDNTTQTTAWTGNVSTLTTNNSVHLDGVAANQYAYANGSNFSINNPVTMTYAPATVTGQTLTLSAANTIGGTGYGDFLKAINASPGASNPNKTFRLDSSGTLQILNSAYTATVFSVTDAGFIAINGSTSATDGVPINNGISMRNNSYIFDDGNYHITSKNGQIWLNSNDGSAVSINQQMPSGVAAGGLKVSGPVNAQSAFYGRTPWNSALDTEVTIDDYRFRISNQGGIFPQIISNTGGTKNSAWTAVAARSGSAITQTGSTGTLVPNNSWTSLYTAAGMDSAGDTIVVTLQDKNQGRIYRVNFIRSDNGSTTGYNIIAERLL